MKINGLDSSLQGYKAAEASLDARAARIAKATADTPVQTEAPKIAAKKEPDFTTDVASLTSDRMAGSYNLKAMKIRDNMLGDLLDILK